MTEQSRVGEILAGKYQLEALLGSGGVGVVYRAQNTLVGRTVAIKLMRPEHVSDPKVVGRFLREARAANIVRHPNVVDVLDIDQDEHGTPFIVQEFLEGEDLSKVIKGHRGGLPVAWVLATLIPVVEAVGLAHSRGVVHRDLKPENVFLAKVNSETVPKLLDFGISFIRPSPGDIRMTATGTTLGTPAFMSPEQLGGTQSVDACSDVWSLGVILFEALSGRLPFDADSAALLFAQIAWAVPPRLDEVAPKVSRDLSRVVARCLRRDKAERYPSAAELARDLRLIQAGADIEPSKKQSLPPQAPLFDVSPDVVDLAHKPPASPRLPRIESHGGRADGSITSASVRQVAATHSTHDPVGVERFGSMDTIDTSRQRPLDPDVLPVAASVDIAAASAGSGIALATLRPKAEEESSDETNDDSFDSSRVWAIAVFALTMLSTAGALMAALHRTDGWPVTSWIRPVLDGSAPGLDVLVCVILLAGGASLAARVFGSPPRRWSLLVTALGLIGMALPTLVRAALLVVAAQRYVPDGVAPGVLASATLIPLGLGLHGLKLGWDYWGEDSLRSRLTAVGLVGVATFGLFAASEILRAAVG